MKCKQIYDISNNASILAAMFPILLSRTYEHRCQVYERGGSRIRKASDSQSPIPLAPAAGRCSPASTSYCISWCVETNEGGRTLTSIEANRCCSCCRSISSVTSSTFKPEFVLLRLVDAVRRSSTGDCGNVSEIGR